MAAAKPKTNAHPHSGSKKVGICVKLSAYAGGGVSHFPEGCKWRYAMVLGDKMLEVMDAEGAIIYQVPYNAILDVSGPGYTMPLWLSREYPTPREES